MRRASISQRNGSRTEEGKEPVDGVNSISNFNVEITAWPRYYGNTGWPIRMAGSELSEKR